MSAPKYSPKSKKESKIPQGARRDEHRRTLNFPDSHAIFRKTLADCGDNAEVCPLLRKKMYPPPEKFQAERKSFVDAAAAQQHTIG